MNKPILSDPATNSSGNPPGGTDPERFWSQRGMDDVSHQRQAQVTWWTVIGGISMAAMLVQIDTFLTSVRAGQWQYILYFLGACFIVVNSWVQTAWGSLVLRWPISIPTALSIFFGGLALAVSTLGITTPAIWYGGAAGVVLSQVFIQVYFMVGGAWVNLTGEMRRRARLNLWIYIVLAGVAILACVHLSLEPWVIVERIWGVFGFILSLAALVWQHLVMTEEKRRLGIA